jgi:RNA polymerase-associated protein CTR9
LKLAYDFYWKVLQTDPTNIYAANGVGVFFAEHGNLDTARDFFIQVREASGDIADAWINLAHVYVQQGLYLNAIKLVCYIFVLI